MADPITHVIVLMMENHSFDQLLGYMKALNPTIDGVNVGSLRSNADIPASSPPIVQSDTDLPAIGSDPHHEHDDVMYQIANNCGGFVSNFARAYPQSDHAARVQIMAFYRRGSLPILHTLAENFTICDHWYSSLPGPTWPNRFFVHSGTCKGHVKMPSGLYLQNEHCYDQTTIYDLLETAGKTWSIYHHGMCHTMILMHLWDKFEHFHRIDGFFEDAAGPADEFPEYVFLEPCYGGIGQNDQHPPTDIRNGELFIAKVYNAIRQNEDLWNTSLFVLLYDEHGGFYDHVVPPAAIPPDDYTAEYDFKQYGLRVPAVLISPYVAAGSFNQDEFDHTSLLKYLCDKWNLDASSLGKRTAGAKSFAGSLSNIARKAALAPFDLSEFPQIQQIIPTTTNEHQDAMVAFSQFLEHKMSTVEELSAIGYRALKSLDTPSALISIAEDRFKLFLHHGQKGRLSPL